MIDTREELTLALTEAAEIEHGLMIQYLFPALSLKKRLDEGLTGRQQALAREWAAVILRVAVEEMGHLGTVCNLLSAIGEGPRFGRPNFPQELGYYPFPFDLVPFGDEALYRMLVFELPRGEPLPPPPRKPGVFEARALAPDPLDYQFVGELYDKIRAGFAALDERELFIGPAEAQTDNEWSVALDVRQVTDRASAFAAIDDIVLDGEGSPGGRERSHYGRFLRLREAYGQENLFPAARAVVRNPRTRALRDTAAGTLITHDGAREVAELFNATYATVLLLLQQFFAYGGESRRQRELLRSSASRLMSTAIRPIAEALTEMPAGDEADPARAGPPFELYGSISVSPFPAARWTIVLERLAAVVREARRIGKEVPRLAAIGETIGFVRRDLAQAAVGQG